MHDEEERLELVKALHLSTDRHRLALLETEVISDYITDFLVNGRET